MSVNDIYNLTRAKPFVPFRIFLSDGTIYDIRHPDMIVATVSSLTVVFPSSQDPRVYDRSAIVSMRHIVRLEPQESAEAAAG